MRAIIAAVIGAAIAAGLLLVVRPLLQKPQPPSEESAESTDFSPDNTFNVVPNPPEEIAAEQARREAAEREAQRKAAEEAKRLAEEEARLLRKEQWKQRVRRRMELEKLAKEQEELAPQASTQPATTQPESSTPSLASSQPAVDPQKLLETPGATVAALLEAGDIALAGGDARLAEALFRRVLEQQPKNINALQALTMALLTAQDYNASIPVYQELIPLLPDSRLERANLALAYSRCSMYSKAEEIYLDLLRTNPDMLEARVNYAIMLYKDQGKLTDALAQWNLVVQQAPALYNAHEALGEIYIDLDQPDKALDSFYNAVKLQPRLPGAWLNVATAAEGAGSGGIAAFAYKQALKLAPYDAEVWRRQGDLHLQLYRISEQQAIEENPTQQGDPDLLAHAVQCWQESLRLDEQQPALRERLAMYEPMVRRLNLSTPTP